MDTAFYFFNENTDTIIHFDAINEIIRNGDEIKIVTEYHAHTIVLSSADEARSTVKRFIDYCFKRSDEALESESI